MLFALDKNATEREFKLYVNRLLLWDKWANEYPDDIFVMSNTMDLLHELFCYPIYPVFEELVKKYKINYVQASDLDMMINRLIRKAKKIDEFEGEKTDNDVIKDEVNVNIHLSDDTHPGKSKDAFQNLLWHVYNQSRRSEDHINSFIVFGKNISHNINLNVKYLTIEGEGDDMREVPYDKTVNIYCRPSLADFFRDSEAPNKILTASDSIDDISLAVRVAVYQNGSLTRVMDAYQNYKFRIQNTFHKDYTGNHYIDQPSFLTSFKDAMSHSLLNMNLVDLEDFRTGKGGNNPQKKQKMPEGIWEAWRWKVTESVSFQYWRLKDHFKFANIGEHDYYVCKWED